jgi:hypothetical protein
MTRTRIALLATISLVAATGPSLGGPIVPTVGGGGGGELRFTAASPDAPALDIYIDGQSVSNEVNFGQTTLPITVAAGLHTVSIDVAGTSTLLLSTSVEVDAGSDQTVAFDNRVARIAATIAPTASQPADPTKAALRVWALSPDAPSLNFDLAGGTALATGLAFTQYSNYVTIMPGPYTVLDTFTGSVTLAAEEELTLEAGQSYTLDMLGLLSGTGTQQFQGILVDTTPVVPVPEPGSLALLSIALAGLIGARVWPNRHKRVH